MNFGKRTFHSPSGSIHNVFNRKTTCECLGYWGDLTLLALHCLTWVPDWLSISLSMYCLTWIPDWLSMFFIHLQIVDFDTLSCEAYKWIAFFPHFLGQMFFLTILSERYIHRVLIGGKACNIIALGLNPGRLCFNDSSIGTLKCV